MPPLIIAAGIAAGGALAGGAVAARGAGKAANAQANAAQSAAQLQSQSAAQALGEQRRQFDVNQSNISPFLKIGQSAAANYANLLGIPFGSNGSTGAYGGAQQTATYDPNAPNYAGMDFNTLINSGDPNVSPNQQTTDQWTSGGTPFHNITSSDGRSVAIRDPQQSAAPQTDLSSLVNPQLGAFGSMAKFNAPTSVTEQNDPGFQFRLQEGQKALERSAAAKGGLLTGGTAQDLNKFSQDYASNEYGNVYNRAFGEYSDQLNRLSSLFGGGQVAAANANASGQNSANNIANILMTSGQNIGSTMQDAAAARASGYQNSGNIWGNSIGSLSSLLPYILSQRRPAPAPGNGLEFPTNPYDPVSGTYPG